MEELRWNRISKVLGHKPRGTTRIIFERFIQEGEILDISKVIPDLIPMVTESESLVRRLTCVYSQSNPDIQVIWKRKDRRTGIVKNMWRTELEIKLKRQGERSFKIEYSLNASKRFPYL